MGDPSASFTRDGSCVSTAVPSRWTVGSLAGSAVIDRYVVLERVGAGASGAVYAAYDRKLDRKVALKLVRAPNELYEQRLVREAHAMARVSHPNVVGVFDVGEIGGRLFLAMEFVQGSTLRSWQKAALRPWSEVLRVYLDAGRGLAAAHEAGLVHRDFKPDNVLIAPEGRVKVTDFGIARAVGETSGPRRVATATRGARALSSGSLDGALTGPGDMLGTPGYMPVEQIYNEEVDSRSDQFSYCVSLYEALYGERPFGGKSVFETADAIVMGRFRAPARGTPVPARIRRALLRGLSAEREDRYPSMAELLAELARNPEQQRRRITVAITLAAMTVAAGGFAVRASDARRAAAEEARVARLLGAEVDQITTLAREAAWLPLHDTRSERDEIAARLPQLEEQVRRLGPIAERPGHEALGRAYLAIERYDDALRELELAEHAGDHGAELSYALGLAYGARYQRALEELAKSGDDRADALRREQIERAYREPALRFLKESRSRDGLELAGVDAPEYVEGQIALYEQRLPDALRLAEMAGHRLLWRSEARTLEGDIHRTAGKERFLRGQLDAAREELLRAGDAYRAASTLARSSVPALSGECLRLVDLVSVDANQGVSPEETVKSANQACDDALVAHPDDAGLVAAKAFAWEELASYQAWHGADPMTAFQRSVSLGEQALQIDPNSVRACQSLAQVYLNVGRRTDRPELLDRTIEYGKRALALDPAHVDSLRLLSAANVFKGEDQEMRGIDPRSSFEQASEYALEGAQRLGTAMQWNSLGTSYASMGHWEMNHGVDPTASLERAVDAHERATIDNPSADVAFVNLCDDHETLGARLARVGEDPQAQIDLAVVACKRALEIDSHNSFAYLNLATSESDAALWQLRRAVDPTAALDRARVAIDRALSVDPRGVMRRLAATVELTGGRWASSRGQDPSASFALAEAALREAIHESPRQEGLSLRELAEVDLARAEWRARRNEPFDLALHEGLALTERALAADATMAEAYATKGALHLVAARTARSAADRIAAATQARAALDRALGLNSFLSNDYGPLAEEAVRLAAP